MSNEALPSYVAKLQSKRVLVIGGTSGIGFAVACAAYENGGQVIIASSSRDKVERSVKRIRDGYPSANSACTIEGFVADLSDPDKLEDQLKQLLDNATAKGSLDHIAFTAGDNLRMVPVAEISVESIREAGTVRFVAPLVLSKLILQRNQNLSENLTPYLKPTPGSSLTLTTGSATRKPPSEGFAIVSGYGQGLEGSMKALSKELRPIRVNVVSPGAVKTELFDKFASDAKDEVMEMLKSETLTGTIGMPEDTAEAYLYCMRDSFVTAHVIGTDGGRLLN